MFNSHIKRMDSYRDFLPLTPNNYKLNYKSHNKKGNIRGGALPLQEFSTSNLWVNPIPPELKGIPQYLLQHPNKYSGSKSQIMIYNSYEDFMTTAFYKQYNQQIKSIPIPPKFAQQTSTDPWIDHISFAYGQKLRVLFTQGDTQGQGDVGVSKNYYSYYLDCININDYISVLEILYKDRDDIQPVEAAAILRQKRNADDSQSRYTQSQADYSRGATDQSAADQAQQEAQQEAQQDDSSDSSDIWGSIKTGLEIGALVI